MKRKMIAFMVALCLLITAFSGNAVAAQVTGLETAAPASENYTNVSIKYIHYYDEDSFSSLDRTHISFAVSFADDMLSELASSECGIAFHLSSTSSVTEDTVSGLDDCPTGTHFPCSSSVSQCGAGESHHKDISRISDVYFSLVENTPNRIAVLWTNRSAGTYCLEGWGLLGTQWGHHSINAYAAVFEHRPVIHFLRTDANTFATRKAHMSLLLVHETVHTLGLDDYSGLHEYDSTTGMHCIMGPMDFGASAVDFYNDVVDGLVDGFCDECRMNIATCMEYMFL